MEILRNKERWESRGGRDLLRRATWLARKRIADKVRARREAAFTDFSRGSVSPRAPAGTDTPSREAAAAEDQERLLEALETLSPDHQRVIELRDFEHLSFAEVGAELGRSGTA